MKICIVGLRGFPDVSGGIETHCEQLYENMVTLFPDLDIVVFGRKPYIGSTPFTTSRGVQVVPAFAMRNKYLETLSNTAVAIFRARFSHNANYLHIHAIGPGLLSPLARILGMRVVLTHHGDDFRRDKWNAVARSVLRLAERVGITYASEVIAVAPGLADRLKADYPKHADKIHFVPNGADHIIRYRLAGSRQSVLKEFDLAKGEYILSVGRLVPEKGFADLIRAHKASGSSLPLVIAGGPSNSDHDRELADLAGENTILTGSLTRAQIAELLSNAKVFVMPSYHEGFPIAALEAWAIGSPLLLSDIEPHLNFGLAKTHYFPVGDLKALADRLRDDVDHDAAGDLPAEFKWGSVARKTAKIYNGLSSRMEDAVI